MPFFTSDGLGLVILFLVLVLRIWSCLHHWLEMDSKHTRMDGDGGGVKISIAVPGHSDSDFRLPND